MIEEFEDDCINEKSEEQTQKDFYASLEEKLTTNHNFPEDYLFKFIFPNNQKKMMQLFQVFDDLKYTISTRESKNGKYISASILAFVLDANQITDIYKKSGVIEGIIML
ncbi:DUF493 family protein [Frigoriflavimonas asaccharolytica]|uniref:DUF493 domain-containing protein n=1 Tax=Frigoriflavimonas asaccharolytica TaxID=2735899 RepID=A0A8J8G5T7_9FLAO|nr:DUF493 family protein [Frigoriflavimonas asaccharolytica]NRS91673.1 hypothetical protein [Frigoriflavimonas asaccharolytica]